MLRDITFTVIGLCIIVPHIVYPYKLYNNYSVFRLWPSPDKVDFLMSFQNSFDFWSTYSIANEYADVMISPNEHDEFIRVMKESKITVKTLIDNVELQILRSKPTANKISSFDFETYHPLANINAYLRKLQEAHPKNVMILEAGKTYENRIIEGVKINMRPRRRVPLRKAVIEGGIHAREWISPAVVVFIIHQLITSADPQIKFLASSYEWHIFPILNPDGYEYSHVKDRLWKKNRSKRYICDEEPAGVDLDRNFDFRWMDVDASNNPCSENFAGLKAFSEVETENYSTYLKSLNQISVYVSFHSYSQMVLIPYGHTASEMDNYNEQMGMASKVADKIQSKYSINYNISTAGTLHLTSGTSTDWVKAELLVPIVLTIELRDNGTFGFLLPAENILPSGEETVYSLLALLGENIEEKMQKSLSRQSTEVNHTASLFYLHSAFYLVFMIPNFFVRYFYC